VVFPEDRILYDADNVIDIESSVAATCDLIFPQWRRYWKSWGLFCQGDSEVARRREKPKAEWVEVSCGDTCPYWQSPSEGKAAPCRYEGNLTFLLWKLPTLDSFQVTARASSIMRVNSDIRTLITMMGRVAKVPLRLHLTPQKTSYGTTQILNLQYDPAAMQDGGASFIAPGLPPLLESPEPESTEPPPEEVQEPVVVESPEPPKKEDYALIEAEDLFASWEPGPPADLHEEPGKAYQMRDAINLIRLEVLPHVTEAEDRIKIIHVLMGIHPKYPRTPKALESILTHFLGERQGEGRRSGGLLRNTT